jgi:hypothetical protein
LSVVAYSIGIALFLAYLGLIFLIHLCFEKLSKEYYDKYLFAYYAGIVGLITFGGFIFCMQYNISAIVNED